jgi:hypothetical protein
VGEEGVRTASLVCLENTRRLVIRPFDAACHAILTARACVSRGNPRGILFTAANNSTLQRYYTWHCTPRGTGATVARFVTMTGCRSRISRRRLRKTWKSAEPAVARISSHPPSPPSRRRDRYGYRNINRDATWPSDNAVLPRISAFTINGETLESTLRYVKKRSQAATTHTAPLFIAPAGINYPPRAGARWHLPAVYYSMDNCDSRLMLRPNLFRADYD